MVCSWLVLFRPLFYVQSWWSYVQAFCVVAIPQSGLLAQVSLFWLCPGVFLPNSYKALQPTPPTPPCPAPTCQWWMQASVLLFCWGSYCWACNLLVLIIYSFFLPVMLPSVLPRLATDSAGRVFPGIWKPLFLKFPSRDGLPFPGRSSLPTSFVSFSSFIFFPTCF